MGFKVNARKAGPSKSKTLGEANSKVACFYNNHEECDCLKVPKNYISNPPLL